MAIVSGYPISREQARELSGHCDHDLDVVWEYDEKLTVGCLTCQEVIIEFYTEVSIEDF